MENEKNLVMLVLEDEVDTYYLAKTDLNEKKLQEMVYGHKENVESLSIDDVKELVKSKGHEFEVINVPYVYY